MQFLIDRFEGAYAVIEIEIGKFIDIPRILIPNAKEGDIIKIDVDKEETKKRKKYIQGLMNNLFED